MTEAKQEHADSDVPALTKKVFDFIARRTHCPKRRLSLKTRLQDYIGFECDAEDFFLEFSELFNVDMTDFHLPTYYYSDFELSIWCFLWELVTWRRSKPRSDILVSDLVNAAIAKRWVKEKGEGKRPQGLSE